MNTVRDYLKTSRGSLRQYGIMGALILIVALFSLMTGGKLLAPNNLASLIQQNAYVMILAMGMVMVIIAGHIDLSVGSVVAFVGGILGWLMYAKDVPWLLAVLAALVVGVLVGMWQGFWVAYVRVPAFIVTLAGMLIFRGLAIVIAGVTMSGFPEGFVAISKNSLPNIFGFAAGEYDVVTLLIGLVGIVSLVVVQLRARTAQQKHGLMPEPASIAVAKLVLVSAAIAFGAFLLSQSAGGTPIVLVLVAILILGYSFVLNRTVFGRHVYAIGGNLNAAVLSGVNTRRVNFGIFVNMGLLAAIAAVVVTSRAGSATALAGQNYELDAIAACFIGGTAVQGGIGRVSGAMIGALIMGVLNMGLSIMNVDAAWQQSIKGMVLLLAVAFDLVSKRRTSMG